MSNSQRWFTVCALCTLLVGIVATPVLLSQTTISTGSIVGTVTDPSGAVVSGARVSIKNRGTGQVTTITTTSAGTYASGALIPGEYQVRVEAQGFKSEELAVTVQVNTTTSGNLKLTLGESSQVVEVQASELAVNTEQATVQGVLTAQQIENLPINGRNFLDLAQLEPGVQIQDGGTFDPTKNGFSSVSFGGRFGRTARIEVDGVDVSDENVGTTTQNIPMGAIQESSLQQSSLDLSTELTSSGSVNITTKSGTNSLHGEGFYYFRDQSLNANLPAASHNPFQRNQFGGSLGGAIIKDKLFFFFDAERTKQDLLDPVIPGGAFTGSSNAGFVNGQPGNFTSPFRETETIGRVDYQTNRYKTFYRFTYDQNKSVLPFIPNSYQPFANVDHARDHVVGVDFSLGSLTNSVRFGYTKFENGIKDAVTGSSIFDPAQGIELAIGADPFCLTAGADVFCSGPNFLAPQQTMQSDHQVKYDGSKLFKNHIIRFGAGFNSIKGGGLAAFLGLAPAVNAVALQQGQTLACVTANNCPFSGGDSNPLNYPVASVTMGNGQGYASAKPAFGLPGGGQGPDYRFSWYIGDSWKVKPNFTVTLGLRYVRDTARTDTDLGPLPALNQFDNQFYSGLGNAVHQPNLNFAPQLGFAWDPSSNGKTVIRGGIGLFYENSIWNNILFDPAARLQKGLFLGFQPDTSFNGEAIGQAAPAIIAAQKAYQAATLAAGPSTNGTYIGSLLADNFATSTTLLAPDYVSPRSVQMNIGVQREIRRGTVLTVDFLRNVSTHNFLLVDTNQVGAASHFQSGAASAAIARVEANCRLGNTVASTYSGLCVTDPSNGTQDPVNGVNTYVPRPATIVDFAKNGLDSGYFLCSGIPCGLQGLPAAAFPGINPNLGSNEMLFPIGRSVYNGLQMTLKQDISNPVQGIKHLNLQVSYSLSRYVATARDNDFSTAATDFLNPTKYIGPTGLDRTHQISFGGYMDLPLGFQLGFAGHFDSPLADNVTLPVSGQPGGIFQTDLTGDGTGDGATANNRGVGDLLPGTNLGDFGRKFGVNGLNQLISKFNTTMVGQATPAGQVLINNGLMTLNDLQSLGGVIAGGTPLSLAPAGAIGQTWLRTFDLTLNWRYRIKDRVQLQPGISFFNVFNFSNFDGPAIPFGNILNGQVGSPNGTTSADLHGGAGNFLRLGLGSGVNALGAPRAMEFQLKLVF